MKFQPPKLHDCTHHGPDSELFIVEGDSAQRALNPICNVANQAVLPMQGKPMNAMKANLDDIVENQQYAALIAALRVTLDESKPADISRIPYGKIILLFDPDADGIHSRTLFLFFVYKWLPKLLTSGRVFDAHAPQWAIESDALDETAVAYTENHLNRIRAKLEEAGIDSLKTKRFRGLGSVGPKLLYRYCVDRETRKLTELTTEHAENALAVFEQMREIGRQL